MNVHRFTDSKEMESYNALFNAEKSDIAPINTLYWSVDA